MVHKTDKIFRQKISEKDRLPASFCWSKEFAWQKLIRKKKYNYFLKLSISIAATLLIVFSLSFFLLEFEMKNMHTDYKIEDEYEEYRKRQKLIEIEMKMSGEVIYNNYCLNCNELRSLEDLTIEQKIYIKYYCEFYQ